MSVPTLADASPGVVVEAVIDAEDDTLAAAQAALDALLLSAAPAVIGGALAVSVANPRPVNAVSAMSRSASSLGAWSRARTRCAVRSWTMSSARC